MVQKDFLNILVYVFVSGLPSFWLESFFFYLPSHLIERFFFFVGRVPLQFHAIAALTTIIEYSHPEDFTWELIRLQMKVQLNIRTENISIETKKLIMTKIMYIGINETNHVHRAYSTKDARARAELNETK